ncbi:MAG: chromate transporter [Chthoniobacterales bacterium]
MKSLHTYLQLIYLFGTLSILSIGGGNTILPEMHRKSVGDYHWMTDKQFADVFAISQAAPGPSILIVTLIGYSAAGYAGAVVATIAMLIPAGLLMYVITRFWQSASESKWHRAVELGLAPIAIGLVFASGYIISKAADHSWPAYLLTAIATVIFWRTKLNPLIVMALAGVLGWLGWIW